MKRFRPLERLLLTAWAGCLWAVGYLAAPVLFTNVDSSTAGMLAGNMFGLVSYVGMVCGAGLILLRGLQHGWRLGDWRLGVLVGMVALVVIGEVVLQPRWRTSRPRG